jgi:Icc-related predicted phosphoesterase
MKITVLGDIHGKLRLTDEMKESLGDADLLFLNGDLTNFGTPDDLHAILNKLNQHTSATIKAVPGNCDTQEVFLELERIGINLHRSAEVYDGLGIIAVGGSNTTPFGTPMEFSEDDIHQFLTDAFDEAMDCSTLILFSHFPPKDTAVDAIASGAHVGSDSLRTFILSNPAIKLVVCGHIHEAVGTDSLNGIPVVNHGIASDGHFVTIDALPDKKGQWGISYQAH